MKVRDLGFVLLKVLAIYLLVLGWQSLMSFLLVLSAYLTQVPDTTGNYQPNAFHVIATILNTGFIFYIALMCWLKAAKIMDHIVLPSEQSNKSVEKTQKTLPRQEILHIAFVIVGLIILTHAVPRLISFVPTFFDPYPHPLAKYIFEGIGIIIFLIFGILLFFGPKKVIRFASKSIKDFYQLIKKARQD